MNVEALEKSRRNLANALCDIIGVVSTRKSDQEDQLNNEVQVSSVIWSFVNDLTLCDIMNGYVYYLR